MSKPTNITELRDQLLEQYDALSKDPRRHNQTKELSNAAGKIISTLAIQLEYCDRRGEMPEIEFMGETSGKPAKSLKPGSRLLNA